MTRSEAIDMLRQICSYLTAGNPVWRTEPIREACDMAIDALTAEPTQTNTSNTLDALDCVERQAALDALEWKWAGKAAIDAIKELPSAERRGKWIHDGKDFPHGCDWIHCSVCGKRGINVPADLTNYCPNCGAKMKEEEL